MHSPVCFLLCLLVLIHFSVLSVTFKSLLCVSGDAGFQSSLMMLLSVSDEEHLSVQVVSASCFLRAGRETSSQQPSLLHTLSGRVLSRRRLIILKCFRVFCSPYLFCSFSLLPSSCIKTHTVLLVSPLRHTHRLSPPSSLSLPPRRHINTCTQPLITASCLTYIKACSACLIIA